jgi:hypothetical protein
MNKIKNVSADRRSGLTILLIFSILRIKDEGQESDEKEMVCSKDLPPALF